MSGGAGAAPRELTHLASLGANLERGLRPRDHQIAYRRFATFPRSGTGSLSHARGLPEEGVR